MTAKQLGEQPVYPQLETHEFTSAGGLTKREYFATLIMAECANRWGVDRPYEAAARSVAGANALLAELAKEQP